MRRKYRNSSIRGDKINPVGRGVKALYGNIRNLDTPDTAFGYCLSGTVHIFCSSVAATGITVYADIQY